MANMDEEGVLMVKDLDTGKMMSLKDMIVATSSNNTRRQAVQEQEQEEEEQDEGHEASASTSIKKGWLRGAKHKMAKMAKKTFTAIQERVDDGMQRSEGGSRPHHAPQSVTTGQDRTAAAAEQHRQSQATSTVLLPQQQVPQVLQPHQMSMPPATQQQQLGPLAMARAQARVMPLAQGATGRGPASAPDPIQSQPEAVRALHSTSVAPILTVPTRAASGSISDGQPSPSERALQHQTSPRPMAVGPLQAALQADRREATRVVGTMPAAPAIELRRAPPQLLSTALRQQQQQQQQGTGSVHQSESGSGMPAASSQQSVSSTMPSAAAAAASVSSVSRDAESAVMARFNTNNSLGSTGYSSIGETAALTHDAFTSGRFSRGSQEHETDGVDAVAMGLQGSSQSQTSSKGKGGLHKLQQWGKAKGEKLMSHLAKHAQDAERKQLSTQQTTAQHEVLKPDMGDAHPDGEGIAWSNSVTSTDIALIRSLRLDQEARPDAEGGTVGSDKPRSKLPAKLAKFIGQRIGRRKKGLEARTEGEGSEDDVTLEGQLDDDDDDEDGTMAGEDQDLYQSHGQALLKAGLPGAIGKPARTRSARGNAVPGRLLANVRLVQALPAHDGVIWAARFHPSGRWLATGGQDGVARIWVSTTSSTTARPSLPPTWQHSTSLPHATSASLSSHTPTAGTGGCIIKPSVDDDSEDEARLARVSPGFGSITAMPAGAPLLSTASQDIDAMKSKPAGSSLAMGLGGMQSGPQLLQSRAAYVLPGHTEDVLDVAWSAGQLLLTASIDGTAKLWHIPPTSPALPPPPSQHVPPALDHGPNAQSPFIAATVQAAVASQAVSETAAQILASLQEYPHPDFVTCVCFHPHDSQLFVSGCADGRVRVWSTMHARVLASAAVQQDMVTCVTWMPGGNRIIAGTLQGKCRHYEWHAGPGAPAPAPGLSTTSRPAPVMSTSTGCKLEYVTTIDVKDRRASAGCGRKLTSVTCMPGQPDSYLVTSNDSRIRVYNRYSVAVKYKGPRNRNTLVKACVDELGAHVVSGSDNGWVYLWDAQLTAAPPGTTATSGPSSSSHAAHQTSSQAPAGKLRPKNPWYDAFHTPESCVTVALIAPRTEWRQSAAEAKQQLLASCQGPAFEFSSGGPHVVGPTALSMTAATQPGAPPYGKQGFSGFSSQQLVLGAGAQVHSGFGGMGGGREQGMGAAGVASAGHATAGSIAALHSPLLGGWMVVGGYSGNLLVYENL